MMDLEEKSTTVDGPIIPYDIDLQHISDLTTPRLEIRADASLDWPDITSRIMNGSYEKVSKHRCVDLISTRGDIFVEDIGISPWTVHMSNKLENKQV